MLKLRLIHALHMLLPPALVSWHIDRLDLGTAQALLERFGR